MLQDTIEPTQSLTVPQTEICKPDDVEETKDSLDKVSYGDLYVLGKFWIEILKTGLLGTKWSVPSLMPVVEAAAPPPTPAKPPKMKYKDLPLYTSPHHDYKNYEEDKHKCPKARDKLIHQRLLPHVASYRKWIQENYGDFIAESRSMKKNGLATINAEKNKFIKYMRCSDNLNLRRAILATGGGLGFYLGGGKGVPRRLFFTSSGLLATGALCFPRETDETFRTLAFAAGKLIVAGYNKYCGKGFALRERLPCKEDIPPPPGKRKSNVCPQKKK